MIRQDKVQYWITAAENGWRVSGHLYEKKDMAAQPDSIIAIVKRYIAELEKHHIPVQEAILYGSYANGRVSEESDIDIDLISKAFTGDRFEDRRRIVPLRRKIDSRIEPMPFTPAGFSEGGNLIDEIKKTGIRIDAV